MAEKKLFSSMPHAKLYGETNRCCVRKPLRCIKACDELNACKYKTIYKKCSKAAPLFAELHICRGKL